jgi:uncharacterized protein YbcI
MDQSHSTVAQQLAEAASAFEQRLTGHAPRSVTVVLSENTLVITLHDALSLAEITLAQNSAGAAKVQEFHSELFNNSVNEFRQEIQQIIGVEVAATAAGSIVQVFATGTVVQVFLLAQSVPAASWSGSQPDDAS